LVSIQAQRILVLLLVEFKPVLVPGAQLSSHLTKINKLYVACNNENNSQYSNGPKKIEGRTGRRR
jgi:hypothetical protein